MIPVLHEVITTLHFTNFSSKQNSLLMSLLHPRILSQGIFVTTLTETKINSLFSFLLKHENFHCRFSKSRSEQQVISTKAKCWSSCVQFNLPGRHSAFTDAHTDRDIRAQHRCEVISLVSVQPLIFRAQLQGGRGLSSVVLDQAVALTILKSQGPRPQS